MEIEIIQKALEILQDSDYLEVLIPEVRSNLVMARKDATTINDVAGIPGRITSVHGKPKAFMQPEWGASSHMARLVLEVMKHDPERRSAINIRYHPKVIHICKKLGLMVSFYNREDEPQYMRSVEGGTMQWGVQQAIERIKAVPDVIYHNGDWGKEPIIALIGLNAVEVAKMVVCIARLFHERTGRQVLFAPSRSSYVGKKSHRACVFCGIAGGDPSVKGMILYQDHHNMVLMNIFPYNRGHLEVVPIKHYTHLNQLSPDELKNIFFLVQRAIKLLDEVIKPDGINLGINLGRSAGSSIEHLHIHLVPRHVVEAGYMEVTANTKVVTETLEETYARFMKKIHILVDGQ